ncbi:MAG: hypothetical protein LBL99_01595 [Holosporaceae bacterium]|jgi:hypothetical protein|nr:hypothetical protein [Holosporaceae bacterium]
MKKTIFALCVGFFGTVGVQLESASAVEAGESASAIEESAISAENEQEPEKIKKKKKKKKTKKGKKAKKKKKKKSKKNKDENSLAEGEEQNGESATSASAENEQDLEKTKTKKKKKKKGKKKKKKAKKSVSSEEVAEDSESKQNWKDEQTLSLAIDNKNGAIEPLIDSSKMKHSEIKVEAIPITKLACNMKSAASQKALADGAATVLSTDKMEKFAKLTSETNASGNLATTPSNASIALSESFRKSGRNAKRKENVRFRQELEKYRRIYSFNREGTEIFHQG